MPYKTTHNQSLMQDTSPSRDWIFISHVTPKNNYQATWLETKLTLLGFKVWVDIKDLRGGDSFWPEIQAKIQKHTAKFLPLITKEYIERASTARTGVRKEISCADGVRGVDKFIIPLRFDDSQYSEFPIEFQEMNGFDFSSNWAEGLTKLVKELEKSDVPKVNNGENYIKKWFEALKIKNEVVEKEEKYYTNWLPFKLPEKIYVHEPQLMNEAALNQLGYPHITESRYVITFVDKESIRQSIALNKSFEFSINQFQKKEDIQISQHFILIEPNKKLIKLLNQAFNNFLKSTGLKTYSQSSDREIFYFPKKEGDKKKISLKIYGRSNKAITGKCGDVSWNYAASGVAKLFPITFFKISHHLYFEKDGKALDKDGQQEYRRSVASGWYNKDWLDMLLAFFQKLKNSNNTDEVIIPLSDTYQLLINCEPLKLTAMHGYVEPQKVEPEEDADQSEVAEEIVNEGGADGK